MKRFVFILFLTLILSGCGGGGRGDDEVRMALQVLLSDPVGNDLNGETLRITAPGTNFTCAQNPTQAEPNDPNKCEATPQGGGSQKIFLTFKSLPAENDTYTFSDANTTTSRNGECVVTIVDSSTLESPGNTVTGDTVVCDQIGAGTPNQLRLTITFS